MAAKGQELKIKMLEEIKTIYPASFYNGKELRVNLKENGTPVQIKISLTVVKSPISNNSKMQIIDEGQFEISDNERADLASTLQEMGVPIT